MTKSILIAVMAGILFVSTPSFAGEEKDNQCNAPSAWEGWNKLISKYPDDLSLQAMHALRIGLCIKIEQGSVSLETATKIFNDAHDLVIKNAKSEHEKEAPSL